MIVLDAFGRPVEELPGGAGRVSQGDIAPVGYAFYSAVP